MLVPFEPDRSLRDFFDDFFSSFLPSVVNWLRTNVRETDKEVIVDVELPGIKPDDINVSAEGHILRIKGQTEEEKEEEKENCYRPEFRRDYCKRLVHLPSDVIGQKAKAKYEDGILTVALPKAEEKKY